MKSEIIAFAWGGRGGTFGLKSNDCGPRGILGGVASKLSSRKSQASATLPIPIALRIRKRRRDQSSTAFPTEYKVAFMMIPPEKWTKGMLREIQSIPKPV